MRQNFFTREELMAMPLAKLKRFVTGDTLGIQSPDEEQLINEVMDMKKGFSPMQQQITLRKDIDIKDQVQEEEWERELAKRVAQMKADMTPMAQVEAEDVPVIHAPVPDEPTEEPEIEAKVEQPRVKRKYTRKIKKDGSQT